MNDNRVKWLSLREAAAHLGVAVRTIQRWDATRRVNGFPSKRRGRVWRVSEASLDLWFSKER